MKNANDCIAYQAVVGGFIKKMNLDLVENGVYFVRILEGEQLVHQEKIVVVR